MSRDLIPGFVGTLHPATFTNLESEKAVPEHSRFLSQILPFARGEGTAVSDYGGAQTLLECFSGVDRRENTCRDKAEVGRRLTVTGRVTTRTFLEEQENREERRIEGSF